MFKAKHLVVLFLVLGLILGAVGCTATVEEKAAVQEEPKQEEPKQEEATQEQAEETKEEVGYAKPESLVSAEQLKEMMDKGEVKVVDFRDAKLPGGYIPGAIKVARGDVAATVNGVKGMIAPKEKIEKVLGEAGITNEDTVVIYDADKELWAARLWWVMKVYGHKDVRLLNGGLTAWESAGFETEGSAAKPEAVTYTAMDANENLIADLDMVKKSFEDKSYVVLDTRSEKEYKDGHVPGAVWIEWTKALNEDGTYKSYDELKKMYEEAGITADKTAIMPHCKSAVRAAHSLFALTELLGYENLRNYDGSWLEYSKSGEKIEK
ncbi:sulfurtransferase [Wukongibacter baidiensis]|uniref:sulfurtransferase n=1 Tax=Wukongibacter baidiensis TaxID=1723361 RepID=UPI003D7F1B55